MTIALWAFRAIMAALVAILAWGLWQLRGLQFDPGRFCMNDETPPADGTPAVEASATQDGTAAPQAVAAPAAAEPTPADAERPSVPEWRSKRLPKLAWPVHWVNGFDEHEAAIVTHVNDETGLLNLGVFTKRGVYEHVADAVHDEGGKRFSWHWPEPDED